MSRLAVAGLALLVLLAGCTAFGLTPDAAPAGGIAPSGTDADSVSASGSPYGTTTLVVAVENDLNSPRDYTPLVAEALAFWETNDERYAGYEVEYRLVPDATDPDVVVSFVEEIEQCGPEEHHAAGCAPHITEPGQFDPPERVRIVGGFSNASTVRVLKHEFGHTLGLTHEDAPADVMSARSVLTTLPQTDALNRSFAWEAWELSVYVDTAGVPGGERDAVRAQVREALAYYDDGAAGAVPEAVSVTFTDNRTAADVVVQVDGDAPCRQERGSCRRAQGIDPDGDGDLERFTRVEVYVVGLDPDAVGWHVGRHVGYALSLDEEGEFPAPLRTDSSYGERRGAWWER